MSVLFVNAKSDKYEATNVKNLIKSSSMMLKSGRSW